jgi:hypothetical protein
MQKMKTLIPALFLSVTAFISCNSNSSKQDNAVATDTIGHAPSTVTIQNDSASIRDVLATYLELKNALVADKS